MNDLHHSALPHRLLAWMLALALVLLCACGGGGSSSSGPAPLQITSQPVSTSVVVGNSASFNVAATGEGITYQWQRSTDAAATWNNVAGATAATLAIATAEATMSGDQYRVVVTDSSGALTSSAATLTVTARPAPPVITSQPANQAVFDGANAGFSVTATGTSLTYQWQASPDGSTWTNVGGATGATLMLPAVALGDSGKRLRVVVANAGGSVTSDPAVLTVALAPQAPMITAKPQSASVVAPQAATFSVAATGNPAPSFQWQASTNGSSFSDIGGATAASYTTPATATTDSGKVFRVRVSNAIGSVLSAPATLTVGATPVLPTFTLQPVDQRVSAPATATFTAAAAGTPTPTYQWQSSSDGGASFANINGATAASYTTAATAPADSGKRLRVVASNTAGSVPSNAATLTVTSGSFAPGPLCSPLAIGQGRTVQTTFANAAFPTLGGTATLRINGIVRFEGHDAVELELHAPLFGAALASKGYFDLDRATGFITGYGAVATITVGSGPTASIQNSRVVVTPPYVDKQYALAAGQTTAPATITQLETTSTTVNGVTSPPTTTTATHAADINTFVGFETVTVPAGTFDTCKFITTSTDSGTTSSVTHWIVKGYSTEAKNSTGTTATAILVDGVPLTRN